MDQDLRNFDDMTLCQRVNSQKTDMSLVHRRPTVSYATKEQPA